MFCVWQVRGMKELTDFPDVLAQKAKAISRQGLEDALTLWFALERSDTPLWVKPLILTTLVYFVTPTDLVPDVLPGGFVDDLGALALLITQVTGSLSPQCARKARKLTAQWFGQ